MKHEFYIIGVINILTIIGNKQEVNIIKNIITDFNDYAVQFETADGKTYFQTEEGFEFEYKIIVE